MAQDQEREVVDRTDGEQGQEPGEHQAVAVAPYPVESPSGADRDGGQDVEDVERLHIVAVDLRVPEEEPEERDDDQPGPGEYDRGGAAAAADALDREPNSA